MSGIDYDLVGTLRMWVEQAKEQKVAHAERGLQDAADEIERLRARVSELEDIIAGKKPLIDGGES